jgi:hypothetical protein
MNYEWKALFELKTWVRTFWKAFTNALLDPYETSQV